MVADHWKDWKFNISGACHRLPKLEQRATNEFDKLIFLLVNENFRKHEAMILKLDKVGYVKIK